MTEFALIAVGVTDDSKDWAASFLSAASSGSWTDENGKKCSLGKKGKIALFSSDWDNDDREIWEIPEARKLFLYVINQAAKSASSKKAIYKILNQQSFSLIRLCEFEEKDNA
jgi:hypothetical protein